MRVAINAIFQGSTDACSFSSVATTRSTPPVFGQHLPSMAPSAISTPT